MKISPYAPEKVFIYKEVWEKVYQWYLGNVKLPPPITISIDPCNRCQMACKNCNAVKVINDGTNELSKEYLDELIVALEKWGVKGACWGGGGCSLMNQHTIYAIQKLAEKGIKSGIVSNGLLAHLLVGTPIYWVGISVDAGTEKTWGNIHGVSPKGFYQVIKNMECLVKNGVHTTYKYLIRPENVEDIYAAAEQAAQIGCNAYHLRPVATPWFEKIRPIFEEKHLQIAKEQIDAAKRDFGNKLEIIGVFDKVGNQWEVQHPFSKCWAIFITCVFQANKRISLCCDLRGNKTAEVGPFEHPQEFIETFWGSQKHREIQQKIILSRCSRCTFGVANEMFEKTIINDVWMKDFI